MAHPNARLTPATRLEMVLEVEAGWSQAEVARRFRVSRPTVSKWWRRYQEEGAAGLRDRTSAPRSNPRRTAAALEQRICAVRRSQGFGPHRIAWALGIARSTAYAVLRRFGLNRLDRLHRVTRAVVRYEHPAPGDLLHIDVKKLGRIPEGGGHRVRGRSARTPRTRGLDYLHVAVDDHSRYAYVAALPDERGPSCAAFLEQALAAFGRRGVRVRGVLTDNAKAYTVSGDFRGVAAAAGVELRHTRPYRPQTNGKAERFIQILQNEWAYARPYRSNAERLHQLRFALVVPLRRFVDHTSSAPAGSRPRIMHRVHPTPRRVRIETGHRLPDGIACRRKRLTTALMGSTLADQTGPHEKPVCATAGSGEYCLAPSCPGRTFQGETVAHGWYAVGVVCSTPGVPVPERWLSHRYNVPARPHGGIGGAVPASRL